MSNVIFYSATLWSMLLVFVQRFSFQVSLMLAPIYRNDKSACALFFINSAFWYKFVDVHPHVHR